MKRNLGEIILVGLVVLILSGLAAFFSIYGLTKLYVSPLMYFVAGGIEFGKLVAVSIIYRHWKKIKKFFQTQLSSRVGKVSSFLRRGVCGLGNI